MKPKFTAILTASAVSILAFSILAQDSSAPRVNDPDRGRDRMPNTRIGRLNGAAKASDVIGMTVKNLQNEKLGKVEELAVDVESGRIVEVIVSTGGSARGYGEAMVAVPPGAFQYDADRKILQLNVDQAKMKGAPLFDGTKWDEAMQSNRVVEGYAYYGQQPYFVAGNGDIGTINTDGKIIENLPRNLDGTINTDAGRTVDKTRNVELARNLEENNNTISTRNPDGTWNHRYYPNGAGTNYAWSQLGYVQRASKVIGSTVKNLQDEKLGKVENLAVDITSGRIVAVIISSGGFLGMGDALSAIPPTALRLNAAHDTLQLDVWKQTLANSPHFKAKQWPDLSQPAYAGSVYRAYNVEPYFATDADSTRENVRTREVLALTPLDQGNNKADLQSTAQIRKDVIATKDLSLNAHNVKIITVDGQVTLRGVVNTAEEKRVIGEIAAQDARPENVHNQLEVKPGADSK